MNYCARHHEYHDHHESCHRCDDEQYIVDVEWTICPEIYIGDKLIAEYELDCVLTIDDRYDLQHVSIDPLLSHGDREPVIIHGGSRGVYEQAIWDAAVSELREAARKGSRLKFEVDERVHQQRAV